MPITLRYAYAFANAYHKMYIIILKSFDVFIIKEVPRTLTICNFVAFVLSTARSGKRSIPIRLISHHSGKNDKVIIRPWAKPFCERHCLDVSDNSSPRDSAQNGRR